MSRISILALAAAMGATVGLASGAQAAPLPAMSANQVGGANGSVDSVQWRRYGYGPRWGYGPRYGYGPRWGYRRGYGGALAAGAALGIVGGAIAAGAASPYYGYPAYGPRYYDPYGW